MLGHLMEWFYSGLAGICEAKDAVAFNKMEIRPEPIGDITHVKADYHSPYGVISSEWTREGKNFKLKLKIPVNTTATIYLPDGRRINTGSGYYTYETTIKQNK